MLYEASDGRRDDEGEEVESDLMDRLLEPPKKDEKNPPLAAKVPKRNASRQLQTSEATFDWQD